MNKEKIYKIVEELSSFFPFKNYLKINGLVRPKYFFIYKILEENFVRDQNILDFGSGLNDLTAIIKKLGYQIDAYDDCEDAWYSENDNISKLREFNNRVNLNFFETIKELDNSKNTYDIVLLLDVLEHVPSPKNFLSSVFKYINKNGHLVITVPNSVSLRKRLSVMLGKTNYASYNEFFDEVPFRGHWREYSIEDIRSLSKKINCKIKHLEGINAIIPKNKFLFLLYKKLNFIYNLIIKLFPSLSDTLCVILEKK